LNRAAHAAARTNLAKAKVVTRTGDGSGGCAPPAAPSGEAEGEAFEDPTGPRAPGIRRGSFLFSTQERKRDMTIGYPSLRIDEANSLHHLWCNNGTWWVHYTLHFDHRKRRIRRSLGTSDLAIAVRRRDALLARLAAEGEPVPERTPRPAGPLVLQPAGTIAASTSASGTVAKVVA
jgi:hypothetical protein